jgi:GNAT superfamily N-acetyltransferase
MAPFRDTLRRVAENLQSCEEWVEMTRDLTTPIYLEPPSIPLKIRWAEKKDLPKINALEGFIQETVSLERAMERGDRCLVILVDDEIAAFAWVTFRDYALALWYTLRLPRGWSYLVYIFVHPGYGRQGLGAYLLGSLMLALRDLGCTTLVSGMFADWTTSIRLHEKMGFRVRRRLTQCKLLHILPYPPKVELQGS